MEDAHKFHLKVWLTKTKAAIKSMFSTLVVQVWLSSERLIKSPIVTGNLFSDGNMPTTPVKEQRAWILGPILLYITEVLALSNTAVILYRRSTDPYDQSHQML